MEYIRIGYFTAFPTCLDPFHGFDPDSYSAISAIHDSLTYIGNDGNLEPALAESWKKITDTCYEFTLRKNVFFHNGEKFNAEAVKATLEAQLDPQNASPTGLGILSSIKNIEILDEYRINIHTHFSDSMLLWRLALFSAIVPPRVLKEKGIEYFKTHPIGTGAFIFESIKEDKEIVLRANPNHWKGSPSVKGIKFLILPASYWVEALEEKKLDIVYGLHELQVPLIQKISHVNYKSRLAALSHWFLLASKGPLLDTRVRIALNLAIDNVMIAKTLGHTPAKPQTGIATNEQFGFNPRLIPYPYDPDRAKDLLKEAGYSNGFTLKGLVADHSASLVKMIEAYLSEVNVKLEYEIVPRAIWMDKIPNAKVSKKLLFEGDFALAPVDNPIMYSGFHHYIFLFSEGPFSLINNEDYDKLFFETMTESNLEITEKKLEDLDAYVHEKALLLFTIQSSVIVAYREGIEVQICANGHLDYDFWYSLRDNRTNLEAQQDWSYEYLNLNGSISQEEFQMLLKATEYSNMIWLSGLKFQDKRVSRLAKNLEYLETIKFHQERFHFWQLVNFIHKVKDLDTILDASKFSGIATYNLKGEIILCNKTYIQLLGKEIEKKNIVDMFFTISDWVIFLERLNEEQGFFGSANLKRTDGSMLQAQIACSFRYDDAGNPTGYLIILRDESRERFLQAELEKSYAQLEQKVIERTAQLKQSLEEIQALKNQQDGDYFLTTLLLKPFASTKVDSSNIKIDSFLKQKKSFQFKNQTHEIGGDINIAEIIYLRNKKFIVFLNADAMGKSIQGAGGIIVLGSIFRSILARQSLNPREQNHYPERWIKVTVKELDLVFNTFDGSMLVSMVFGLIDEERGFMYYINSEHPDIVLYRDKKASFIRTPFKTRKIGFLEVTEPIYVNTFQMKAGDQIIIGSDGRDDIVTSHSEDVTHRTINDDPELFLTIVEEADAELENIFHVTTKKGEVIDDFSLLKFTFTPSSEEEIKVQKQIKKEVNQLIRKKKYQSALNLLYQIIDKSPENEKAMFIAAFCHRKLRQYESAIDLSERIRLRNPENVDNLYYLSLAYFEIKNLQRALKIIEEGLKVSPHHEKLIRLRSLINSA